MNLNLIVRYVLCLVVRYNFCGFVPFISSQVMSIPQEAERGVAMTNPPQVEQDFVPVLPSPDISNKMSATNRQGSFPDAAKYDMHDAVASEVPATGQAMNRGNGRAHASVLLDERSLLACIVRAIPAGSGGQIRISTTVSGYIFAIIHLYILSY